MVQAQYRLVTEVLDSRLNAPFTADANDFLYQWESSGDYTAAPQLGRIKAALLVINSADDERNPPETGLMERELRRVPGAKLHLIPASVETRGHGTTGMAMFYKAPLQELLQRRPNGRTERRPLAQLAGWRNPGQPQPSQSCSRSQQPKSAAESCSPPGSPPPVTRCSAPA